MGLVTVNIVSAEPIAKAVIELAQANHSDAIVVGASREAMLQQATKGNILIEIACNSNCSVILVRGALA